MKICDCWTWWLGQILFLNNIYLSNFAYLWLLIRCVAGFLAHDHCNLLVLYKIKNSGTEENVASGFAQDSSQSQQERSVIGGSDNRNSKDNMI